MEIDDQETTDSQSQSTSEENEWPPWVKPLLETSFFSRCRTHTKYKCDLYCIDCYGLGIGALCLDCIAPEHQDHKLIEVEKLPMNVAGVDANDLDNTMEQLDITGVFQKGGTIYLNKCSYPLIGCRARATSTSCCRVCRSLIPVQYQFCCLSCKVAGTPPSSPPPPPPPPSSPPPSSPPPPPPPPPAAAQETGAAEVPATGSRRKRRRKGIPHRSPLA